MAIFTHAHTAPVNPPGAEPVLTREQVWAGMQRKVRSPTDFVPAIASCEVVSEDGDVVTRVVEFKASFGPAGKIKEVCTSFHPTQVTYEMESGDKVSNIISTGPAGEPADLFLTYLFELKRESVNKEESFKVAKEAVAGSIAKMRELAKEGQI